MSGLAKHLKLGLTKHLKLCFNAIIKGGNTLMDGYKKQKLNESLWKTLTVIFAIGFLVFIIYYRLDATATRFRVHQSGDTLIFIDKYVDRNEAKS